MYQDLIDMDLLRQIQDEVLKEMSVDLAVNEIEDLAQEFKIGVKRSKDRRLGPNTKPQRYHDHHEWETLQKEFNQMEAEQVNDMEDVQFDSQKLSTRCPITKKTFVDPVMNPSCKHVYSRQGIMELMNDQGRAEVCLCPSLTVLVSRDWLQKGVLCVRLGGCQGHGQAVKIGGSRKD
jgi:hypothetical protein